MRLAIGLDDLRSFYLISEAGGVSAAERRFGVSKATLSRALSRLEQHAEGPLFDRVSNGVKLTAAGETLLEAARQATQAGVTADEILRAVNDEPSGTLRVAASALSGQYLLGPVVARLAKDFPNVTTRVFVTADGPDPIVEDLDLVLRLGRPDEPNLIARRICATPMRLYCGESFAARYPVDDPAVVTQLPRVVIDVPGAPSEWRLTGPENQSLVCDASPCVVVGDPSVALGMIRSGVGITLLPALFANQQVARGEAVPVLPEFDTGNIDIFAVFPPGRSNIPAVRVLIDYLVEEARRLSRLADA